MSTRLASTITSKGQATIPAAIREALHLKSGDKLAFELRNNKVTITKLEPFDYLYHASVSSALSEWDSEEDEEAYGDL